MEKIVELRKANPGGGPHSLTGPIFVNGAQPGDVLEIRIRKIVAKRVGTNFNLPGKEFPTIGALATQIPEGTSNSSRSHPKKRTAGSSRASRSPPSVPGHPRGGHRPRRPVSAQGWREGPPGAGELAPSVEERIQHGHQRADRRRDHLHSRVPGWGPHLDGRLALPQGNGEVNLTAMECSFESIGIQPIVHHEMKLTWPRIETKTHWITVGFDEDLGKAMVNAVGEMVDFLAPPRA